MDMDFIQIGLNTATLENKRRAYRRMLDASLVDHRVGAFVEYTYYKDFISPAGLLSRIHF